jgi:hypothetical protein
MPYTVIYSILYYPFAWRLSTERDSDMDKPNGLDRKCLQTQLENYKLIAEVNTELLDEDLFAKAEFLGKLELAQRYINESRQ